MLSHNTRAKYGLASPAGRAAVFPPALSPDSSIDPSNYISISRFVSLQHADGAYIVVRAANSSLFVRDSLACTSKHNNRIAFSVDLELLTKVFRAASSIDRTIPGSATMDVRLTMKPVAQSEGVSTNKVPTAEQKGGDAP